MMLGPLLVGLVGLVCAAAGWVFCARRRGIPADLLDLSLALFGLVGLSSLGSLSAVWAMTGSPGMVAAPPFLALVAGTAAGQVAVAIGVLIRCRSEALGLVRVGLGWGLGAPVGLVALFELLSAGWSALMSALGQGVAPQQLVTFLAEGDERQGLVLLFAVGLAPVCEELLFRGLAQGVLAGRMGAARGLLLTGGLFGLMHLGDPAAVVPLIGLGLGLGLLRAASGSLWPPLIAHTLNNLLAVLIVSLG